MIHDMLRGLRIVLQRRKPKPGETWQTHWTKGTPWPRARDKCTVVDVKDGFVKWQDWDGGERISSMRNFKDTYFPTK